MTKSRFTLAATVATTMICACSFAASGQSRMTPAEAKQIAIDTYIYGYSLITTEVTRVQMSNVPKEEGLHAPMGKFINVKRYPPGDYRGVSAPNADTLYSLAWLDVGPEPVVFSHPIWANVIFCSRCTACGCR